MSNKILIVNLIKALGKAQAAVPTDDIENTADDARAQGALSELPVHGIPLNADDSCTADPCDISQG